MKRLAQPFLLAITLVAVSSAQQSTPLRLMQTLEMGTGITGKFDHMTVDLQAARAFLTAPGHHSVEVFDLKTGKWMHSVGGLGKPAGIVYFPKIDRVVFSDGEPGSLNFLNPHTFEIESKVQLTADADSVGLDQQAEIVYVDNGGKDVGESFSRVSAVDLKQHKNLGDIRIDGNRLEAMVLEAHGPRLFVNDTALNKVVVIDRNQRKVVAQWDITVARENVAMALDEADRRLFVATRSPGTLVVLDTQTGRTVAHLAATGGADDLAYDNANKRIYLSGEEGFVDVYQRKDPDTYFELAKIATRQGARNSRFVPEQARLYVSLPATNDGRPAEIQVYAINPSVRSDQ